MDDENRMRGSGDHASAELLEEIYADEVTHVAAGVKWLSWLCARASPPAEPVAAFHALVREHFQGRLKPPFNHDGRARAGLTPEWYEPLAQKK